jgi:hypothetical protein
MVDRAKLNVAFSTGCLKSLEPFHQMLMSFEHVNKNQ